MLRSLKRWLRTGRGQTDAAQLSLELVTPPQNATALLQELRRHGLRRVERCHLTRNRNVMVSWRGAELRVHEGYLAAPAHVLAAIVQFVEGRTRSERRAARHVIVGYSASVGRAGAPERSPRRAAVTLPEDQPSARRLESAHRELNERHFGGSLREIPIRVSRRMRSRLGHYSAASDGRPGEIAISWRHLKRHGWDEACHTLLHEMVHQWQDESRHAIDHGPTFRAKAREVGIAPLARRALAQPRHGAGDQSIGRRAARGA